MTLYNVFDTKEEADQAQFQDYTAWKQSHYTNNITYLAITNKWDTPVQRTTDNKWVYQVCPDGSQEHTQEEFSSDWFVNPQQIIE